jgi:hypothetical protein
MLKRIMATKLKHHYRRNKLQVGLKETIQKVMCIFVTYKVHVSAALMEILID